MVGLADWMERRQQIIYSVVVCDLCFLLMALFQALRLIGSFSRPHAISHTAVRTRICILAGPFVVVLLLLQIGVSLGVRCLFYVTIAEIFPAKYRATGKVRWLVFVTIMS